MQLSRRILAGLAGLALLPFAATFLTAVLAGMLGCETGDAGAEPCLIFGADAGGLLSGLLAIGGFVQLTIPLFMSLLAMWLIVEAVAVWRRRRRARRDAARPAA